MLHFKNRAQSAILRSLQCEITSTHEGVRLYFGILSWPMPDDYIQQSGAPAFGSYWVNCGLLKIFLTNTRAYN